MQLLDDRLRLSASDLANHLACRHLTVLEYAAKLGEVTKPQWSDPRLDALRSRGEGHEAAFLAHLRSDGIEVLEIPPSSASAEAAATAEAMRRGVAAIAQATLVDGRWMGRADVLRRVPRPSRLGDWSYEVMDTKLARTTKAGTVLQLCLYSTLVESVQGVRPERAYVVKPLELDRPEVYRLDDYLAYFRQIQRRLGDALPDLWEERSTYPDPVPHCDGPYSTLTAPALRSWAPPPYGTSSNGEPIARSSAPSPSKSPTASASPRWVLGSGAPIKPPPWDQVSPVERSRPSSAWLP